MIALSQEKQASRNTLPRSIHSERMTFAHGVSRQVCSGSKQGGLISQRSLDIVAARA